eukprot:173450_1
MGNISNCQSLHRDAPLITVNKDILLPQKIYKNLTDDSLVIESEDELDSINTKQPQIHTIVNEANNKGATHNIVQQNQSLTQSLDTSASLTNYQKQDDMITKQPQTVVNETSDNDSTRNILLQKSENKMENELNEKDKPLLTQSYKPTVLDALMKDKLYCDSLQAELLAAVSKEEKIFKGNGHIEYHHHKCWGVLKRHTIHIYWSNQPHYIHDIPHDVINLLDFNHIELCKGVDIFTQFGILLRNKYNDTKFLQFLYEHEQKGWYNALEKIVAIKLDINNQKNDDIVYDGSVLLHTNGGNSYSLLYMVLNNNDNNLYLYNNKIQKQLIMIISVD